jgi:hypothetical protein
VHAFRVTENAQRVAEHAEREHLVQERRQVVFAERAPVAESYPELARENRPARRQHEKLQRRDDGSERQKFEPDPGETDGQRVSIEGPEQRGKERKARYELEPCKMQRPAGRRSSVGVQRLLTGRER